MAVLTAHNKSCTAWNSPELKGCSQSGLTFPRGFMGGGEATWETEQARTGLSQEDEPLERGGRECQLQSDGIIHM